MNKEKQNLLVFGYGLAIILAFIGTRLIIKHGAGLVNMALLAGSGFMLVITVLYLQVLKVIYKYWMIVAQKIGHVVTLLILSIMFYVIFGIVGIILRLLKKDLLDQSLNPKAQSYWQKRTLVAFKKERYKQQF